MIINPLRDGYFRCPSYTEEKSYFSVSKNLSEHKKKYFPQFLHIINEGMF